MIRCFVVLFFVFSCLDAFSQPVSDCAALENAAKRLICYDKIFRNNGQPGRRTPSAELSLPSSTSSAPPPPTSEVVTSNQSIPDPTQKPSTKNAREFKRFGSQVHSITRRARNEMAFHLANDQIWVQISPRYVTIKEGDNVEVRKQRMGGYILINERGASTRVSRLR